MPRSMHSRLRHLTIALLAGGCGAAVELLDVALVRPWTAAAFRRSAVEIGALWIGAGLGLALLAQLRSVFTKRAPAPAGAVLLAPLGWAIAWTLNAIDPRGNLDSLAL